MKNTITVLLLAVLSGCYNKKPETTGFEGKPMPVFNLLMADSSTRLNTASIPAGKPIVLCCIGTRCPYSRAEIKDIVENIKDLDNVRLYIFTSDRFRSMKSFYNYYQLGKYPNISVGVDSSAFFGRYFQTKGVPYTAIYSKDKKLLRLYAGQIDAALIKNTAAE